MTENQTATNPFASDEAAELADKKGVDWRDVTGSGTDGKITVQNVRDHLDGDQGGDQQPAEVPEGGVRHIEDVPLDYLATATRSAEEVAEGARAAALDNLAFAQAQNDPALVAEARARIAGCDAVIEKLKERNNGK